MKCFFLTLAVVADLGVESKRFDVAVSESPVVEKARASCAIPPEELKPMLSEEKDYDDVLNACARNVMVGPFTATSGLVLPYLLNAATNLLDKTVAMQITRMTLDVIDKMFKPADGSPLLVMGMETGGGIMVGQCAAIAPATHPDMLNYADFTYIRKKRKTSGSKQQLEGPQKITQRTPSSPLLKAVWLDEANSSGASLRDGAKMLKRDYNIELLGAVYIVDRSKDRKNLPEDKLGMADPVMANTKVVSFYDLDDVDKLTKEAD